MSRFTIELSAKADSHWAVHKDGVPVAWFEGTNAAERWIAEQESHVHTCLFCETEFEDPSGNLGCPTCGRRETRETRETVNVKEQLGIIPWSATKEQV